MDLYLTTESPNKHWLQSISARKVKKHPELMQQLLRLLLTSFWSYLGKFCEKKWLTFSHLQELVGGRRSYLKRPKKGAHSKNKHSVVIS